MVAAMPWPHAGDLSQPNRLRGITFMLAALLLLAIMNALVRHVSQGLHALEIVFFRQLFGVVVLLPWLVRQGLDVFRTRRPGLHAVRGVVHAISMTSFFYAVSIAPLTDVTALFFAAPIFGTLLAAWALKERTGPRRWAAILVGFAGALIVLRPGFGTINPGLLYSLLSAFLWAVTVMIIRTLSREDSSVTITAYMALWLTPITFVPALFVWQWPGGAQWLWLIAIGLIANVGHLLMNQAIKDAAPGVVMPLEFFRLIFITVIAYVAFAEIPSVFAWIGGTMIFGSGVYIAYRERVLARAQRPEVPAPP